jgi:hypothetical protein
LGQADSSDGPLAEHPHSRVDGVDVEVADEITAHGNVVDPDEVLQPALKGSCFRRIGEAAAHTECGDLDDSAEPAVPDAAGYFLIHRVRGHLVVHPEAPLPGGGLLAQGQDLEAARNVCCHGLGHVNVQSRIHCGSSVFGEEEGRRFESDRLDPAFDDLLVRREPRKAVAGGHTQCIPSFVSYCLKVISHRDNVISAVVMEEACNPTAPSATAHHPQLDLAPGHWRRGGAGRRIGGERR